MKDLWNLLTRCIEDGEPVVTAKVIRQKGSAPRGSGTWLLMRRDGDVAGTVGGGVMEARVLESALELFATRQSCVMHISMTQTELGTTSMICGGKVDILLDYWEPDDDLKAWCRELAACLGNRTRARYVIDLKMESGTACRTTHLLVLDEGRILSGGSDQPLQEVEIRKSVLAARKPSLILTDRGELWVEPLQASSRLLLMGAGHVGKAAAILGDMTGFETVVFDDRPDLLRRELYAESIGLRRIDDFTTCLDDVQIDDGTFIVIVTRGHLYDRDVLAQALRTDAAYIGMIGSRKKRDTIYKSLLASGFSEVDLKRVYSPIGIDIRAETPEELAVSIVGELIRVRAEIGAAQSD